MLNAQKLLHQESKNSVLPESGGMKFYGPDESEEQKLSVSNAFDQFDKILHEERICRKSNLSVAYWNKAKCLAVVEIRKGSCFHKFGYENKEGLFLYPEESLFLIDQGLLELKHENMPLSIEEAYILLVPHLPSLEYYQVFSYLCKMGYLITRFKESNDEGSSKSKLDICPDHAKAESAALDESVEPMASGHVKELWTKDQHPLVRPEDAKNTAAILSKLQIVKVKRLKDVSVNKSCFPSKYKIDFNVYISKDAKKSDLGVPNFRVAVCKYSEPPPSLLEMSQLSNMSVDASLKYAVVDHGTVSFYGMFGVDLPTLISQG